MADEPEAAPDPAPAPAPASAEGLNKRFKILDECVRPVASMGSIELMRSIASADPVGPVDSTKSPNLIRGF